ncbi:Uncharacterised protein [Mycobacteroides abscessus subsp. abscessus]|uniref:hypothetical protein n=1 Tax=Mycobacteroides abscessus TaxID=36809 RepID=UPI00092BD857|nr:hypothetical protein [Mycobacteroides abscessus]SHS12476.1 Uncharacterised protein [Mycobacteroides abscessus subsp. abscessus]SHT22349.1 Uncharacterised protein [Mycobacteroides abscessus subsp. abscessus]SIB54008.1 Uncharacterised protein [Mycobacteroides abscessus subsp. abscessus]SID72916.1 Uncharacterised protein [Mycobacteroides abscessus subsp. abscessus]SKW64211.1 Uncharacterised protein [Mycobacteroides abscessus subsp. abscessus]
MDHSPGATADYANAAASDALRKAEQALREADRLNKILRAVVAQLGYRFTVDASGNVSVAVPQ